LRETERAEFAPVRAVTKVLIVSVWDDAWHTLIPIDNGIRRLQESDIPAAHHGIRARYVCLAGNIAIPDFLPSA
jgi:hypothetical protein